MANHRQEADFSEPWNKTNIVAQLQRDILPLLGFKNSSQNVEAGIGLRDIELSFPGEVFPTGCIHEFLSASKEDLAATTGFIAGILSRLMRQKGICLWISASRNLFPAALKSFALEPDQFIFIDLKKERDILWTLEETLKCERVTTVVGELREFNFKESRRLQLATEQSRVTGFLLRHITSRLNTIASVSRWHVTSLPSGINNEMPGVTFPRWNVELLKVRNGKPGNWKLEWVSDHFKFIEENILSIVQEQRRKTGS